MAVSSFRTRGSVVPVRWSAITAIVRRDYHITRSYRLAFGLDLFFGVANLLLYYFISRTFGKAAGASLDGAPSYFAFAVAGIVVIVVVQAASTALAMRIREEQLTGTLEALVVQPITSVELCLGLAGFPFVFAFLRAIVYIALAAAFLGVPVGHADWPGMALVLLTAGAALTGLGIALGGVVLVLKKGDVLASIAIFVLGLVGGALFSISVLPGWLQPLADVVPTRFALDGLRAALYRGTDWGGDVLILVLFAAITFPLAVWIFDRALRFAERSGSLAQY
jgi:ABC-2 type transport system permease protein